MPDSSEQACIHNPGIWKLCRGPAPAEGPVYCIVQLQLALHVDKQVAMCDEGGV